MKTTLTPSPENTTTIAAAAIPKEQPTLLSNHTMRIASPLLPPNSPRFVRTLSNHLHPHHHSLLGIILVLLGSFCFSCLFLFVKLLQTTPSANVFVLGFYRALVEIPIAIWGCYYDMNQQEQEQQQQHHHHYYVLLGPPHKRPWLWVRGGMGSLAVLCFFYAIQHLPLPDAVTLQFTTPPFAAAFAVCFAQEPWRVLDKIGAVVCLLGVILIAHPSWLFGGSNEVDPSQASTSASNTNLAIAIDILGAAFAGLAYMSVRKLGPDVSANLMVLYYSVLSIPATMIGSKAFVGTWNVLYGPNDDGPSSNLVGWQWGLVLGTGITAYAGQYLVNLGLQLENAATATLATCSQIVFTYLFELIFLHESINGWSVLGTTLIIGFMMMVGYYKMKQQEAHHKPLHRHDTTRSSTLIVAGEPEELALLFSAEHETFYDEEERTSAESSKE